MALPLGAGMAADADAGGAADLAALVVAFGALPLALVAVVVTSEDEQPASMTTKRPTAGGRIALPYTRARRAAAISHAIFQARFRRLALAARYPWIMSMRSFALAALGVVSLIACTPEVEPQQQPSAPEDPTTPTPSTERPKTEPEGCSVAAPVEGEWTISTGLVEQSTRRVAATDASLFLFEGARLLRSSDNGQSWAEIEAPASYLRAVAAVGGEVFLSGYANEVGNAVWRSQDEGASWQLADGLDNVIVNTLRADGGVVVAETRVWSTASESFETLTVPEDLFLDRVASDGETYLGATYGGVYRSSDGVEWLRVESLNDVFYPRLVVSGSLAFAIDSQGVFLRSIDGGATFEYVELGYAGGKALDVLVSDLAVVIATTTGFMRSLDAGATFELTKNAENPEVDAFFDSAQFLAGHGAFVVAGGAAVEVSTDAGASWLATPPILDATPWALGSSALYLVASTADMALHFSEGNDEWIAVDASNHAMKAMASDGDKTFMLMVQALAGSAYFPDGDLIVSYDGGFTYDVAVRPENNYMTTFDTFERAGGVLFLGSSSTVTTGSEAPGLAGGTGLWRSFDDGHSWDAVNDDFPVVGYGPTGNLFEAVLAIQGFGGEGEATELLVSVANHGVLYSDDAGERFELTALPASALGGPLAIDGFASNERFVFAGSKTDSETLLRFDPISKEWASVADGLPEAFTLQVLQSHGGLLFAGIDAGAASGLYVSPDEGDSWQKTDLLGVPVSLLVRGTTLFAGVRDGGLQSIELGPCE